MSARDRVLWESGLRKLQAGQRDQITEGEREVLVHFGGVRMAQLLDPPPPMVRRKVRAAPHVIGWLGRRGVTVRPATKAAPP